MEDFIERFEADGAICLRAAIDPEQLELLRCGIERNISSPSPFFRNLGGETDGFLSDMWSRRYIPEFQRFCTESPAAAIAARAMRADSVRLAQDTWFMKRPGSGERTPWHHDTVVDGPFCSLWVALDPTPRAATLEFVRGSHAWGKALMPKSFFEAPTADTPAVDRFYAEFHGDQSRPDAEEFGEIPDIEADRDAYDIIGWDMEPGDCVLFDARTIHGAPGNSFGHCMRRFVTRWVTDASVVARHGQEMIDALAGAGLDISLRIGGPIRGDMFPEFRPVPASVA